jgi:hypothetical protein
MFLDFEEHEKKRRQAARKAPLLTARICRAATSRDLELWLALLNEELEERIIEKQAARKR